MVMLDDSNITRTMVEFMWIPAVLDFRKEETSFDRRFFRQCLVFSVEGEGW